MDLRKLNQERVQEYNFKTPRRFTKDNVRLVGCVFDCFAKTFANKLTGLFGVATRCDVTSIQEMVYGDFSQQYSSDVILPVVDTRIKEGVGYVENHFVLLFPCLIGHHIVNKLLGGLDADLKQDHEFTDLELSLLRSFVVANVIPIVEVAWSSYIDIIASCTEIVSSPGLTRHINKDVVVLVIDMKLDFPPVSGSCCFCLPVEFLTTVFRNLGTRFLGADESDKMWQKKSLMLEHIKETEVDVNVVLGGTALDLGDVLSLHPGDIMMLDNFTDSSVLVNVRGEQWFRGRVGIFGGRKAVKITEVF
ncbi:MAG: FliM/FliN family flagellar motor switch protein [Oscillospiraceae bacterium]|jgi:flagellar motor switch protein FliM|nr:FliM/FliN family flagellar motor switch protein [Oscillospiraceae bacterium]